MASCEAIQAFARTGFGTANVKVVVVPGGEHVLLRHACAEDVLAMACTWLSDRAAEAQGGDA